MSGEQRIEVTSLHKEYRVHRRKSGLANALGSVFRRTYETVSAVQDLSFTIAPGERVGFLGPNGAGKTTTLKILSGLLHPTSGRVAVAGHEPRLREHRFLRRITLVMGQKQQLLWDLPPGDTFLQNRAIYDIPRASFDATLKELDDLLGIGALAEKPTRQLSLGERMKCELAAALLHRPDVLFLDEPTIGLDVSMQLAVREFIRTYNERTGATTLLTSHYMDDVAALCPRVIVIDHGKLRYDGALGKLVEQIRPDKSVVLRYTQKPDRAALERLGTVTEEGDAKAVVRVARPHLRDAVAQLLLDPHLADLTIEDPPLEEVLRELFARSASASPTDTAGTDAEKASPTAETT
ncbi:MAG: ATP-binding cassette domain-containing protein [Polyangiaceae bacterium]